MSKRNLAVIHKNFQITALLKNLEISFYLPISIIYNLSENYSSYQYTLYEEVLDLLEYKSEELTNSFLRVVHQYRISPHSLQFLTLLPPPDAPVLAVKIAPNLRFWYIPPFHTSRLLHRFFFILWWWKKSTLHQFF